MPYTEADDAATTLRTPAAHGRLEHVERSGGHHVDGGSRVVGALGDPQRGLMEHDVDALHRLGERRPVADVADRRVRPRRLAIADVEVLAAAAHEVVEHDDRVDAGLEGLVGDRRADEPGAAGDQDARSGEVDGSQADRSGIDAAHADTSMTVSSIGWARPPASMLARAASSMRSTRSPERPSVIGCRCSRIDATSSSNTPASAFTLAERRRHHVADAVGDLAVA